MIKSNSANKPIEKELITYPCLMELNSPERTGERIVLFCKDGIGTVLLDTTDELSQVGEYSGGWQMHMFSLYTGMLELANNEIISHTIGVAKHKAVKLD